MRNFVLRAAIERLDAMLETESEPDGRRWIECEIAATRRELALLTSATVGLHPWAAAQIGPHGRSTTEIRTAFEKSFEVTRRLQLLLEPGPGLHIAAVSGPYAAATMISATAVRGEALFEVFPDNPAEALADGVSNLFTSLQITAARGRPHRMPVQRYDVQDPEGRFVERYWLAVNTPVFDPDGRLANIVHEVRDVTAATLRAQAA